MRCRLGLHSWVTAILSAENSTRFFKSQHGDQVTVRACRNCPALQEELTLDVWRFDTWFSNTSLGRRMRQELVNLVLISNGVEDDDRVEVTRLLSS